MPIQTNAFNEKNTMALPDMSKIIAQTERLSNQLSVLNEQLVNVGTQFQSVPELLSSETVKLNETAVTVFNELAGTVSENVRSTAESIGTNVNAAWVSYVEMFFSELSVFLTDTLSQTNEIMTTTWSQTTSSMEDQLTTFILDIWEKMLEASFAYINNTIIKTITDLEASVLRIYDATVNNTYSDIKKETIRIYEEMFDFITGAWEESIKPMVSSITTAVDEIKEKFIILIGEKIIPLIDSIEEKITIVWDFICKDLRKLVNEKIGAFIKSLNTGIKNLFDDVKLQLKAVITSVNDIIANIFSFLKSLLVVVGTVAMAFIGSIMGGILGAVLGGIFGKKITEKIVDSELKIPSINFDTDKISTFKIPYFKFATGGVVSSPTYALIGEGHYSEAVMPLENSPQMKDFINKVAAADRKDQVVQVFIGNEQLDEYIVKSRQRRMLQTNGMYA